jgi:hypothetical protein
LVAGCCSLIADRHGRHRSPSAANGSGCSRGCISCGISSRTLAQRRAEGARIRIDSRELRRVWGGGCCSLIADRHGRHRSPSAANGSGCIPRRQALRACRGVTFRSCSLHSIDDEALDGHGRCSPADSRADTRVVSILLCRQTLPRPVQRTFTKLVPVLVKN